MTTLFDIALQVAIQMGDVHSGIATGGGAVGDVVDSYFLKNVPNNYFKDCALFITSAGGADPEGYFGIVHDSNPSNFTVKSNMSVYGASAAVTSADGYLLGSRRYPLSKIIASINLALKKIGGYEKYDTSLATSSSQTEYTLPAGVYDVREVHIANTTGDADDNQWNSVRGWRVQRGTAGSTDTLIFDNQPPTNRTIRVLYAGEHAWVQLPTDNIENIVSQRYLVVASCVELLRERMQSANDHDPKIRQQVQDLTAEMTRLAYAQNMPAPARKAKLLEVGGSRRWITSGE